MIEAVSNWKAVDDEHAAMWDSVPLNSPLMDEIDSRIKIAHTSVTEARPVTREGLIAALSFVRNDTDDEDAKTIIANCIAFLKAEA